ncbi:MAG: hypothetical protein WD066_06365 [Planctomycetaceae bacterium]
MPTEPLRFIHAADCLLDSPLRDLGPLPAPFVETVVSATTMAFEQVVAACLEREVDFLLLTGNAFDEAERSLAARIALVEGCGLLAEAGIDVLAWPGERDPRAAWKAIPELPENVVLLPDDPGEVIEINRDDRPIAEIVRIEPGDATASDAKPDAARLAAPRIARFDGPRRGPFVIGLRERADESPRSSGTRAALAAAEVGEIDYLALGGGGPRRTNRSHAVFVHHPGATQGLSAGQTGPHGCTLIEVDDAGISRATFVPTAAVRRERFPLAIESYAHRDDLLEAMAKAIGARRAEPGERLWLCQWRIFGTGRLFEDIADEATKRELIAALAEREALPRDVAVHHEFHLTRAALDEPPLDPQRAEFHALLEGVSPADTGRWVANDLRAANIRVDGTRVDAMRIEGTHGEGLSGDGETDRPPQSLDSPLDAVPADWPIERRRLEPAAVLGHARALGDHWPGAVIEEAVTEEEGSTS